MFLVFQPPKSMYQHFRRAVTMCVSHLRDFQMRSSHLLVTVYFMCVAWHPLVYFKSFLVAMKKHLWKYSYSLYFFFSSQLYNKFKQIFRSAALKHLPKLPKKNYIWRATSVRMCARTFFCFCVAACVWINLKREIVSGRSILQNTLIQPSHTPNLARFPYENILK